MKKRFRNHNFFRAITKFITLSIIIVGVGLYFVFQKHLIGPVFLGLGFMSLLFLKFFKIKLKMIYPDLVFGAVDNFVLVFAAVLGGIYGGVFGAVIGGAIGNTITDGFGGLMEGHTVEKLQDKKIEYKRTALSSSLGKMTGCLFGGGTSLTIISIISLF